MKNNDINFDDIYLKKSFKLFLEKGVASITLLQKELLIDHSRASKIINTLEFMGLISQFYKNHDIKMLVTKTQTEEFFEDDLDSILGENNHDCVFDRLIKCFKEISKSDFLYLSPQ